MDARALFRQQQAQARITHPLAQYSSTGKLSCLLCQEAVKSERLWSRHLQTPAHQKRAQQNQVRQEKESTSSGKRRHSEAVEDYNEPENGLEHSSDDEQSDIHANPRKRSRANTEDAPSEAPISMGAIHEAPEAQHLSGTERQQEATPPPTALLPGNGVAIQIPSRPATPRTNKSTMATAPSTTSKLNISDTPVPTPQTARTANGDGDGIDEDEWAQFEAEIATAEQDGPVVDEDVHDAAVISAAPKSKEELAALEEEAQADQEKRSAIDKAIDVEKEEATLAIARELGDMADLEAQIRQLKQRRHTLRHTHDGPTFVEEEASHAQEGMVPISRDTYTAEEGDGTPRLNIGAIVASVGMPKDRPVVSIQDDESEEEASDESEDDWDGFRFTSRTR